MRQERGGVYVERGTEEVPEIVHVDDLPALERDAIRTPPPAVTVPRETRGGVFVDAPDERDPDERQPPKHVDDMTPEERSAIGLSRDLDAPIDLLRGGS